VAYSSWFFVTINCVPRGKNQLCRPHSGDAVLAAIKFNHERCLWRCGLCLLMPDHLHAIMAFPHEPGIATTIKNWKKFVAEKYTGSAIFLTTVCAIITNWKRKQATSR